MKPITELTPEEKNRELCALLSIHWHDVIETHGFGYDGYTQCICGKRDCYDKNPNFLDDAGAVRLLRELEKQEWYYLFLLDFCDDLSYIGILNRLTTPGLLADKVIEWRGKKPGDS